MNSSFDAIAAELEMTGCYRVLRRLEHRPDLLEPPDEPTFTGLIVDVETTGTDLAQDEVIELGMLKFEYGASGRIYRVIDTFCQLHQPRRPLPLAVSRLTGISPEDLGGRLIDDVAVQAFAADATLVIAHYASFDRPMCERRWPIFAKKEWACSCTQVPWRAEGHAGTKLGYLLMDRGCFHDSHRAINDCQAVLWLLTTPLKAAGQLPLASLLEASQQSTVRLWATDSPIKLNHLLKTRRYRWSSARRSWYIDLIEDHLGAELRFLSECIYQRAACNLPIDRITALDRFSIRAQPHHA